MHEDARKPRVLVMMATYNGTKYLSEQIDSILGQEGVDVRLWINDDRSTDSTYQMCVQRARAESRIIVTRNDDNMGSRRNFLKMLSDVEADGFDWFAFSDQDDVWLPEKLFTGIKAMDSLANNIPLLYCSRLQNCYADLAPAFMSDFRPDYFRRHYNISRVATMGIVAGCTMVFNPALLAKLKRLDLLSTGRWHDELAAIIAGYFGKIIPDETPYIMRRIHGGNVAGRPKSVIGRISGLKRLWKTRDVYSTSARELLELFGLEFSDEDRRLLHKLANYRARFSSRIGLLFSTEIHGFSWKNDLYFRLRLLFGRV